MYIDLSLSPSHIEIMNEVLKTKFTQMKSRRDFKDASIKTKVTDGKMNNGYKKIFYREYYGRYMAILTNPCFPFMKPYRLVVHFSQWKILYKLFNGINSTFGNVLGTHIINNGELARLDVWVDKSSDYQLLKKFVYKPKISISEEFKGERGTTYLGSRKSDSYDLVYEKTDEDDLFKANPVTRFERVLKGNSVPIIFLKDYPILAHLSLFTTMHCEIPKDHVVRLIKDESVHPDIREFLDLVLSRGLYLARKKLSRKRGFYTRVLPFWKEHSYRLDLSEDWKAFMQNVVLQEEKPRWNFMDGCEIVDDDDDRFDENGMEIPTHIYELNKKMRQEFEIGFEDHEVEFGDDESILEDDEVELENDEINLGENQ